MKSMEKYILYNPNTNEIIDGPIEMDFDEKNHPNQMEREMGSDCRWILDIDETTQPA